MHVHVLYFIVYLKGVVLRVRKTCQINLPIPNKNSLENHVEIEWLTNCKKELKVFRKTNIMFWYLTLINIMYIIQVYVLYISISHTSRYYFQIVIYMNMTLPF